MNQNNDTLKNVLFLAVLGYFSADSIMILVSHGWPFGAIQWILCAIVIACISLFFILLKKVYDEALKGKSVKERKKEDETEEESKI